MELLTGKQHSSESSVHLPMVPSDHGSNLGVAINFECNLGKWFVGVCSNKYPCSTNTSLLSLVTEDHKKSQGVSLILYPQREAIHSRHTYELSLRLMWNSTFQLIAGRQWICQLSQPWLNCTLHPINVVALTQTKLMDGNTWCRICSLLEKASQESVSKQTYLLWINNTLQLIIGAEGPTST
jgi:hypothetical protein